jgi:hypothetical protein
MCDVYMSLIIFGDGMVQISHKYITDSMNGVWMVSSNCLYNTLNITKSTSVLNDIMGNGMHGCLYCASVCNGECRIVQYLI